MKLTSRGKKIFGEGAEVYIKTDGVTGFEFQIIRGGRKLWGTVRATEIKALSDLGFVMLA